MTVKVAKGLRASFKNATDFTVDEVLFNLKTRTDCYEVLNDVNRPYGDIDGKCDPSTFEEVDRKTREELESFLSTESYCLLTASSVLHNKISWRFVMTNYSTSKADNKLWVSQIKLNLPEGVKLDTGVYGTNQKMRMLNSNKDGENRPLRLVKGEPIDTIISYIPEGCQYLEVAKKTKETLISKILNELTRDSYEDWITIGMVCFNENEDVEIWNNWSRKSSKWKAGECQKKWSTFTKGTLGIDVLWNFLKEDNPSAYEQLKCGNYEYMKIEFEKTHFKLMNPPLYVRLYNGVQFLKSNELHHLYNNHLCDGKLFIDKWVKDSKIRTYENLVYLPKQDAPPESYNIFVDFECQPAEGSIETIQTVLNLISNGDKEVFDYIEKWVAHLIQKPFEKSGICIVVQGEQGVGKDTYFDFVGQILGEYFFNTGNAENDIFSRFNGHLKKTLLIKSEEASFMTNKNHADKLKNLITCKKEAYEDKGAGIIKLDSYVRVVMTTNAEVPVPIEQSDRRFVLIKASSERMGDLEFWKSTHDILNKKSTLEAYYNYLLNLDISNFNPRDRPITEYYETVKETFIPYHAQFFQRLIEESPEVNTWNWKARELMDDMKIATKFDLNQTKFGRDMKLYPVIKKKVGKICATYTSNTQELIDFLKNKRWWYEF
jgi:hypothetical protein